MKKLFIIIVLAAGSYLAYRSNHSQRPIPDLSLKSGSSNPSSEFLNAQKSVEYLREEISKNPGSAKNFVALAELFLQESRITGDHHLYIPKAQYLLEEALRLDPGHYEANLAEASLLLTKHRFDEAKEIAEKMALDHPHSASAYGLLCDAYVELGDYSSAVSACDRMLSIRPDLRSYARASYLREIHGDTRGAIEAMTLASEAGMSGQENRAWALYNLGKLYLNEGKLDRAEYIFEGILQERPRYAYALSGLSMVNRARGNMEAAINLLTTAAETTPEHVFLEQLADAYLASGKKDAASGLANIVLKAFEQHEKDGWNINREMAMFCANHDTHLTEALYRARSEYARRPDNADVLESYAWVLYKCGRAAEAVPLIERAMRFSHNFQVLHHASLIYAASGEDELARKLHEESLTVNPFEKLLTDGPPPTSSLSTASWMMR